MHFLSDRTTALHKEYLEKERLSLSFYLKSYPELCGKSACEILRTRCKEKKRIALLMLDIICHERYFDSFGNQYQASETVREWYNTEASFLYETFKAASETTEKYLFIFNGNKGVEMR